MKRSDSLRSAGASQSPTCDDPSDSSVIRDLGFDALESLALGLDDSIVTLRYTGQDLVGLLKTPPALRSIFATVRERVEPVPTRHSQSSPLNGKLNASV